MDFGDAHLCNDPARQDTWEQEIIHKQHVMFGYSIKKGHVVENKLPVGKYKEWKQH